MILYNDIGLIGDFVGTIPAMIELSKTLKEDDTLVVVPHEEIYEIFDMIPSKYKITRLPTESYDQTKIKEFNLTKAFGFATQHGNLHMIQSHYHFVGLPVPKNIPRPELEFLDIDVPIYDYVIAPFGRSLPDNQRWQKEKWYQLVTSLPDKKFAFFGNPHYDFTDYLVAPNVTPEFGRPFVEVANIMTKSKNGLISVVTGPSHLSYALNVKNYLLEYQSPGMLWGINPEAKRITKQVDQISVAEVLWLLKY